jgi:hypothetical protein
VKNQTRIVSESVPPILNKDKQAVMIEFTLISSFITICNSISINSTLFHPTNESILNIITQLYIPKAKTI